MNNFKKCSDKEFNNFRKFFPFSCVDIILLNGDSILLTKRRIGPYKNKWPFPGGIVRKNEHLKDAIKRIGLEELKKEIKIKKYFGIYENLNSYRHDISHCYLCKVSRPSEDDFTDNSNQKFFQTSPNNMIPYHRKIMEDVTKYIKNS